jgi:hypothetical protein
VLCLLVAQGQAQVNPPPWWGSTDGQTTSFCWQFSTPSFPPQPDYAVTPFGPPTWDIQGDVQWSAGDATHFGVYCARPGSVGSITVCIPNRAQIDYVKHVWLQVDFFEDNSVGSDVTLGVDAPGSVVGNVNEVDEDIGGGWTRATVTLDITPQPDQEWFTFYLTGGQIGAYIDNLYIGTHCEPVPEPATLATLGAALAALATRGRRR